MHYRSWVFLALFGPAGVSAAEDAKPVDNTSTVLSTSTVLTEEDIPSLENAAPPKTRPLENHGSSRTDGSEPGGKYGRKKSAVTSSKVSTPPEPTSSSIPERLGQSDIMAVIISHKPSIIRCVNDQKKREPNLTGRLVMRFLIRPDGSTLSVQVKSAEFAKTFMASCITQEIKSWTFPRHKRQGDPIDFPFIF
jgi:hypothetical protein